MSETPPKIRKASPSPRKSKAKETKKQIEDKENLQHNELSPSDSKRRGNRLLLSHVSDISARRTRREEESQENEENHQSREIQNDFGSYFGKPTRRTPQSISDQEGQLHH